MLINNIDYLMPTIYKVTSVFIIPHFCQLVNAWRIKLVIVAKVFWENKNWANKGRFLGGLWLGLTLLKPPYKVLIFMVVQPSICSIISHTSQFQFVIVFILMFFRFMFILLLFKIFKPFKNRMWHIIYVFFAEKFIGFGFCWIIKFSWKGFAVNFLQIFCCIMLDLRSAFKL